MSVKYDLISTNDIDNINDKCYICDKKNNSKSITLSCGCGNRYHSKCAGDILKCPKCNKIFIEKYCFIFFAFILSLFLTFVIMIILISFFINFVIFPIKLLIRTDYCDDNFVNCPYYETTGLITNSTIIENVNLNNFVINYNVLSTYSYNTNKTCVLYNDYNFISYIDAQHIATKTIGMVNEIFVSYADSTKCVNYCHTCLEIVKKCNNMKMVNFISFSIFLILIIVYMLIKKIINNDILVWYECLLSWNLFWIFIVSCIYMYYAISVPE